MTFLPRIRTNGMPTAVSIGYRRLYAGSFVLKTNSGKQTEQLNGKECELSTVVRSPTLTLVNGPRIIGLSSCSEAVKKTKVSILLGCC